MFTWESRCILCPHIYSNSTITELIKYACKIRCTFTCTSSNVIYGIICQQCPSGFCVGQRGQTLCKRINEHKFDISTQNKSKIKLEHFILQEFNGRSQGDCFEKCGSLTAPLNERLKNSHTSKDFK